jgi:ribosomal protein S18 acetylase RimI-like enzyme
VAEPTTDPTAPAVPEHVRRFWRALDERFARVEAHRWGAVVTDPRFPRVWDVNYARIEQADPPDLDEVEAALLPATRRAGASTEHLVTFAPASCGSLLAPLLERGHLATADLVMELQDRGVAPDDGSVEALPAGPELWRDVARSFRLFGVDDAELVDQLVAIERDVLGPAGKRWVGVRGADGAVASLGASIRFDGVTYVDNVATVEAARGRGYASAVTRRLARDALDERASHVCLLADPDDVAVVAMYERLGFAGVGRLAATRGPLPAA